MRVLLNDMKSNVSDVTNVNNNETAKSYASVLTAIKNNTNEIKKKKIVRSLAPTKSNDIRTPKLTEPTETIETPKQNLSKNRKLTSGTSEPNNNNLGSPVNLERPEKVSPFAHLKKSIYVSPLKNNVTIGNITSFIQGIISEVKLEDFALNLLVTKDQAIDALSFISYRLRCTVCTAHRRAMPYSIIHRFGQKTSR